MLDMKFIEDLKKKFPISNFQFSKKKKEGKDEKVKKEVKKDEIPKELLDKLPPGVKIKRIVVGPKQVVKLIIWLILGYWILSTLTSFLMPEVVSQVPISQIIQAVKKDEIKKIVVADNQILATLKNEDKVLVASKETAISMTEILQKEGIDLSKVELQIENRQGLKMLGEVFGLLLTVGLPLLLILWFFKKQSGGAGGGVFGFGKSTAKLFIKGKQSLTFKDVAGVEEAKNDLVEIVDFLKHPEKYQKMGARAPKGVLLVGPSGVGKTLLAKAVAGEAGVPFYSMAGSEFMEMLVGVGASRVRDLFGTAKKAGKAIIFIDEIDAIGRVRGGMEGGNSEREQTLNQILVEMDGFEQNSAVVVLAATNRGDLLDPALLRPGRFDRRVVLELPDLMARQEILKIHAKGKPFEEDVNWEAVSRATVGFSGAELENMLNEAAIGAARLNKTKISMKDIDEAGLKVKMGAEKRRSQSDEDKLMTAYHEAGHAIVNYVEELDPVSKISIISRGMALGFTLIPPQKDVIHYTKSKLIKQMAMSMGGRAAEEIIFGDITTGAASDISHATNMAKDMVIDWGMSELGPINFGSQINVNDFGKSYLEPSKLSDKMQGKIDEEVKKFIDEAYTEAKKVLTKNKEKLDQVAKVLAEKESLDQKEFEELMV